MQRRIKTATKNQDLVRERRETLINAAIKVFVEKGFHNATVRDIGRDVELHQPVDRRGEVLGPLDDESH